MPNKVIGRNHHWIKEELIGKGDAGEVFRVTSKDVDGLAVLKCPSRVATGGTILRQASQIEQEGRILERLAVDIYEDNQVKLVAPKLLDESPMGTALTGAYFIVSSQARGTSLADMIRDQQRGMQNISQRFMMKLISALFHLYDEIHAKGIVWNDVKPDHLFWDADQNTLMVIDWANGRILDNDEPQPTKDLAYLEDLKQMLNEFGRILQTVAPDLIMELGWPDFKVNVSTMADVDVLRKRCTFLDRYLTYRVVENRALEAMVCEDVTSIEDLTLLISSQQKLADFGEEIDRQEVEKIAEGLLLDAIDRGDVETSEQIITMVIAHSYKTLGAHWQITSYLLKLSEQISQDKLANWVHLSVSADWATLFWEFKKHSMLPGNALELKQLANLVRRMVLPGKCYSMQRDAMLQQFRDDINVQMIRLRLSEGDEANQVRIKSLYNSEERLLTDPCSIIHVKDWEVSLKAMDALISAAQPLGLDVDECLVLWMKSLKQLIRELNIAWGAAGLNQIHDLLHAWLIWDPQAEFLLEMDEYISQLDEWLTSLVEGPGLVEDAKQFIKDMLEKRPMVERYLEQTHWLKNLQEGMEKISIAKTADEIQKIYQQYAMPMAWVSEFDPTFSNDMDIGKRLVLDFAQNQILESFHMALKSDAGLDVALREIKINLPWAYPAYQELVMSFDNLFLAFEGEIEIKHSSHTPETDQPKVQKALTVLAAIRAWQGRVAEGMLSPRDDGLEEFSDWKIARDCIEAQQLWSQSIMPCLDDFQQKCWHRPDETTNESDDANQSVELSRSLAELGHAEQVWQEICQRGVDENYLDVLIGHLDAAQESYLNFTSSLAPSKPNQFIKAHYQTDISEHVRMIKRLKRITTGVQQAFQVLTRDEMLNSGFGDRAAEELILGMVNLNRGMPVNDKSGQIDCWQAEYQAVIECTDEAEFRQIFADLDVKNPLSRWFQAKWQGFTDKGLA